MPNLIIHRSKGMCASQLTRLQPFNYFIWCVFEREVNQHSQSTLTSLHAKISGIMTVMDREIVNLTNKKFRSRMEAVAEACGDLIK
jgi:hypothetical protein